MIKRHTYKELQNYLQHQSSWPEGIFEKIKIFSNAGLFAGNMLIKLPMVELTELMSAIDILCDLGSGLCKQIGEKLDGDYYDRWKRIQYVYGIAAQVAYLEELRETLKGGSYGKLYKLLEKALNTRDETAKQQNPLLNEENDLSGVHFTSCYVDYETTSKDIKEQLIKDYQHANNILLYLVQEKKKLNEEEWRDLGNILEDLPRRAYERYCALYIDLADQYNDFALFMQWTNQQMLVNLVQKNSDILGSLIKSRETDIDVGLNGLRFLTEAIEKRSAGSTADQIVLDLKNRYEAMLEKSVIEAGELEASGKSEAITYPKISESFIPQSFKLLNYQKDMKVEAETVWQNLCTRDDLTEFILEYLNSEKSITHPLLILGQPGSGKSLLTTVLAARLTGSSYTVVRIPLREVDAEKKLDVLVEEAIRKLTTRTLEGGYGNFAAEHANNPILIILDGYDELLQARENFSTHYIEDVRDFQKVQCDLKRPVRVIVTSRITLMNKVLLAEGTAVLKLLPFDEHKKERWIQIWNQANESYFCGAQVQPFALPENAGIQELAEQPLLLLMLAIYDSERNELAKIEQLRRTELYNSLFRRFVQREQSRYIRGFEWLEKKEQEIHIQKGIKRLGIAAIGMYNRGKLVIRTDQLEADLHVLLRENEDMRSTRNAEKLIGGFFFIHSSVAKSTDADMERPENAYEFLHNTFGEFFAADFILKVVTSAIRDVRYFQLSGKSKDSYRMDASCFEDCFRCLMYVPLFTRPVILHMIREHAWTVVTDGIREDRREEEWKEFYALLKEIVLDQINTILGTRVLPDVIKSGVPDFERRMPVYGHLATYSMNLVILVAVLSKNGFRIGCSPVAGNTWEGLTALWRSWFGDMDMLGLTDVIVTRREYDRVTVSYVELPEPTNCDGNVDAMLAVANTLADPFLTALAGVHTSNFQNIIHMQEEDIAVMLDKTHPDFFLIYSTNRIRRRINELWHHNKLDSKCSTSYHQINDIICDIFNKNKLASTDAETEAEFLGVVENCLTSNVLFITTIFSILRWFFQNRSTVLYAGIESEALHEVDSEIRLISHIKMLKGKEILITYVYPESESLATAFQWNSAEHYSIHKMIYLSMAEESVLYDADLHLASFEARDNDRVLSGYIKTWEDVPRLFSDSFTLECLVELNINWIASVLWMAVRSGQISNETKKECVAKHFEVLNRMMSDNEGWIPLHAIELSCRVAKGVGRDDLAEQMKQFVHDVIRNYRRDLWDDYLYQYPCLVIDFVKLLPETAENFVQALLDHNRSFLEKASDKGGIILKEQVAAYAKKLIEHVSVVRFLVSRMPKAVDRIRNSVFVHELSEELDNIYPGEDMVTLRQVNQLLWFAGFTENEELEQKCKRWKKCFTVKRSI